jgi:hypothetical protein
MDLDDPLQSAQDARLIIDNCNNVLHPAMKRKIPSAETGRHHTNVQSA